MGFLNRLKAAYRVMRVGLPQASAPIEDFRVSSLASSHQGDILAGKNVLISGTGPNIGKSLALEMGKQGAHIFFTDLDQSWITDLENQLQIQGVSCKGFVLDIRKTEDVDALCTFIDQNEIRIDVVVHNATIEFHNTISLLDFNHEEWLQTYATNVFGPMYLTKCIVERMRRQGKPASIIFLTSIQQFNPSGWTSYSSSKAALGMIIKELAVELATFRIRVNGIAPGPVKVQEDGSPRPNRFVPLYKTHIPPELIGRAAVFLASDFYSYCTTGTVLTVDGGISLHNHHSEQLLRKRKTP
jgi:NAD(P)-dependent dehydrogenase (short-subunit alcohol dehydrogenase family)